VSYPLALLRERLFTSVLSDCRAPQAIGTRRGKVAAIDVPVE
jgi:hypothetical protein